MESVYIAKDELEGQLTAEKRFATQLQAEMQAKNAALGTLNGELSTKTAEAQRLRTELQDAQRSLEENRAKIAEFQRQLSEKDSEIEHLTQKCQAAEKLAEDVEQSLRATIAGLQETCAAAIAGREQAEDDFRTAASEIRTAVHNLAERHEGLIASVGTAKASKEETQRRLANAGEQLEKLHAIIAYVLENLPYVGGNE